MPSSAPSAAPIGPHTRICRRRHIAAAADTKISTVQDWPLTGRAEEMQAVADVLDGDGAGLLIAGGPGVGKTRLARAGNDPELGQQRPQGIARLRALPGVSHSPALRGRVGARTAQPGQRVSSACHAVRGSGGADALPWLFRCSAACCACTAEAAPLHGRRADPHATHGYLSSCSEPLCLLCMPCRAAPAGGWSFPSLPPTCWRGGAGRRAGRC